MFGKQANKGPRGYLTMDDIQPKPDSVVLAADLRHQLEETRSRIEVLEDANQKARSRIEVLEDANQKWSIELVRAKATADAYKTLILELHYAVQK